jgi:hypothetical protein
MYYLYTGEIRLQNLSSYSAGALASADRELGEGLPTCSPKAMYRLADKVFACRMYLSDNKSNVAIDWRTRPNEVVQRKNCEEFERKQYRRGDLLHFHLQVCTRRFPLPKLYTQ